MDVSLPEFGAKLVNVLNAVALGEIPNQQVDEIKNLTPAQRDRLAKYCNGSEGHRRADGVQLSEAHAHGPRGRRAVHADGGKPLPVRVQHR
jgi:hypothetical protein